MSNAILKIAKCHDAHEAAHWIGKNGPALVVLADDGSGHVCYHCVAPCGDGELLGYYGLTLGISVERLKDILMQDAGERPAVRPRTRPQHTPENEERLHRIADMYYEDCMTQREIAEELGISRPRVSQILREVKVRRRHEAE